MSEHDPERPETTAPEQPQAEPVAPLRRREPLFNIPAVVVLLVALNAGIHLLRVEAFDPEQDFRTVLLRFAFFPIRYTGGFDLDPYAFVSPVSYSLLHGGWMHLAVNMVWLAAFGTPVARRLGGAKFLLFWVFTALAAVALHFSLHPFSEVPLVGASGAISGMMGAAARFGFRVDRSPGGMGFTGDVLPVLTVLRMRLVVTFLAVWMLTNLIAGFGFATPGMEGEVAWEAHIGGFLAGFLGIGLFARAGNPFQRGEQADRP